MNQNNAFMIVLLIQFLYQLKHQFKIEENFEFHHVIQLQFVLDLIQKIHQIDELKMKEILYYLYVNRKLKYYKLSLITNLLIILEMKMTKVKKIISLILKLIKKLLN